MKLHKKALKHLSEDALLGPIIQSIKLEEGRSTGDVYFDLLSSICSQQLSTKAAATIRNRFLCLFEDNYPNADKLLAIPHENLRGVGLSNSKALYMKNIAEYFTQHNLFHTDWTQYSNEEIINMLTQIKGVGKWTTEMILMFSLHRSDILPVDDLGIQQAMQKLCNITSEKKQLHLDMIKASERWRPYRTIACLYLWAWKDDKPKD